MSFIPHGQLSDHAKTQKYYGGVAFRFRGQCAGLVPYEIGNLFGDFNSLSVLDENTGRAPRPTPTMIDIGSGST
jgi:hypothetical protein